jgi:hypothetical protein
MEKRRLNTRACKGATHISAAELLHEMSEVLSLREKVAQAEV